MKRPLSFGPEAGLVLAATSLVAGTYGLVRLAYGLFLSDVQASLGLGTTLAGWISSGASIAYCVGAVLGLTAERHARALVVAALSTAGLGALGMAAATDVAVLAVCAVVSSAGAGLASPALVEVVSRHVDASRRDRAQSVVNAGTGPGLVVAGLLALALLPHWRLALAIGALTTVAAGLAVLRLDRTTSGTPLEPCPGPAEGAPRARVPWVARLVVPASAALLLGAGSAAVWTYGRALLVGSGAGGAVSTLAWVALGLGGTATVLTAGWLSRRPPRRAWLLTGLATASAVLALGALPGDTPGATTAAVAACAVFGWGFVAATSVLIAWVGRLAPARVAAGTALLFVTLVLGQAVGSAITGAVAAATDLGAAFVVMAVVVVAAAAHGLVPPAAGRVRRGEGSRDRR